MQNTQLLKALSNDTVFNCINKHFTSLQQEDVKNNNRHLQKVLSKLIEMMEEEDAVFKRVYRTILFGGSFYKGTRVSKPSEFDLDVVIVLPMRYNTIKFHSCQPGFTRIYVGSNPYVGSFTPHELRTLNKFIDNGYLNQAYFRRWMERIITKVFLKLHDCGDAKLLLQEGHKKFTVKIKKSGPAFTIFLNIPDEGIISIDFVPALAFTESLQNLGMRSLIQYQSKTWLAIPKPLTESGNASIENIYWRFSFYYQEKEILSKHGRVKPVIRQMKKFRDVQRWNSIPSYYIETLFLNELENLKNLDQVPFTLLFYKMLKKLFDACVSHRLNYFWDENYNLLAKIRQSEMVNIVGRLRSIITNIEKNITSDPYAIAKYILYPAELQCLQLIINRGDEIPPPDIRAEEGNTSLCKII